MQGIASEGAAEWCVNGRDNSFGDFCSLFGAVGVNKAVFNFVVHVFVELCAGRVDAVEDFVHGVTKDVAAGNVIERHCVSRDVESDVDIAHKWRQRRGIVRFVSSTNNVVAAVFVVAVALEFF